MFNLVRFPAEKTDAAASGYTRIYSEAGLKGAIAPVKTLAEAVNYKNRSVLLVLESFDMDEGAIRLIAEKQKACFLIDFSGIVYSYGTARAIRLSRLRGFLRACLKHGARYALCDRARSEREMRTARELIHLGLLVGLNTGQSKMALKMLGHYARDGKA